jgi:hypothetical protein
MNMSDKKDNIPQFKNAAPAAAPAKEEVKVEAPPSTRDLIRDIMSELMPAMMSAQVAAQQAMMPRDPRLERAAVQAGPKCNECKQLLKACNGEHESIVVYPVKYPEFGVWFRGVGINGVWYRSDNPGQFVTVPKVAVSDIQQTVLTFEENERETRMGRVGGHNFGNANSPALPSSAPGWR